MELGGQPPKFSERAKPVDDVFEGGERDAFSRARDGRGQVHMIEFRRGEESEALGFPWLAKADKSPGELVLDFGTHLVSIRGSKLGELYEAIVTHRLRWVRVGGPGDKFPTVVTGIDVAAREE